MTCPAREATAAAVSVAARDLVAVVVAEAGERFANAPGRLPERRHVGAAIQRRVKSDCDVESRVAVEAQASRRDAFYETEPACPCAARSRDTRRLIYGSPSPEFAQRAEEGLVELAAHYLSQLTWQQACDAIGVDFSLLPKTIADTPLRRAGRSRLERRGHLHAGAAAHARCVRPRFLPPGAPGSAGSRLAFLQALHLIAMQASKATRRWAETDLEAALYDFYAQRLWHSGRLRARPSGADRDRCGSPLCSPSRSARGRRSGCSSR